MIKEFLNPDRFTTGIGRVLSKVSPNPNVWSILSFLPALLGFYSVYRGNILWGFILFLVSGFLDIVDGTIARSENRTTYFGAFLDGTIDRFVDFLIVFSFFFLELPDFIFPISWWIVIAAYFALMPTFIVAYANHRKAVPDPTEKVIWRILHRSEMYPLFLTILFVSQFSLNFAVYLLVFTTVLSIITTFQTIILTALKSKDYPQS